MGHLLGQTAQLSEVGGARLMQNGTGTEEQQALEERVVHGVVETGRDAQCGSEAGSRQDIADLGDGVEGQQTLEVVLGQGHRHADKHADRAKEDQPELDRTEVHDAEEDVGQADDTVEAALGQNAGDQHRHRSRSRTVGIRRQRVERYDEGLGAEADEEHRVGDDCRPVQVSGQEGRQLSKVQRVRLGIEHDGAGQDAA